MRKAILLAGASTCLFFAACDKPASGPDKSTPAVPENAAAAAVAAPLPIAGHLGFATRVPADADVFFAGYHADELHAQIIEIILKKQHPEDEREDARERLLRGNAFVGDESFIFLGPGAGAQLQTLGATYRELSAASIGTVVSSLLKLAEKSGEAPGEPAFDEKTGRDLLEKWMDALEKDARLQIPSLVAGWKPHPEKLVACAEEISNGLGKIFEGNTQAVPVSFEASGITLTGHELRGREVFGKLVEEVRKELAKEEDAKDLLEHFSQERMERLLTALENLHFIVATGTSEGRVLIYLGNGKEGFRLAATPEESLAATADLKWTHAFADKRIMGTAYFSKEMIGAALPWLDSSAHWEALAKAVGPPIRDEAIFRALFGELAQNDRELAVRQASAWSAIAVDDAGWRLESRGGWPDPTLDYSAPLQMTAAALAQKPVIRAHWVQNRERNDLEWKRVELLGVLLESAFNEMKGRGDATMEAVPADAVAEVFAELRALNRAYREEFRRGLGDEVALVADFKGEMPPVPGISEEMLKNLKIPRFVVARDVRGRALIETAGRSTAEVWKNLTTLATKYSGAEMPLIMPQKLESDGVDTWFLPAPFIGGDFVPGVSVSDKLWMLGTSRELASGMVKGMSAARSGSETGMIVEIDFAPVWGWAEEMVTKNGVDAGKLMEEEAPPEMKDFTKKEDLEEAATAVKKLKGLSYRKWLEEGTPRTSFYLKAGE